MKQRKCRVCGMVKPLSRFSKNKTFKSGYSSLCYDCKNKRAAEDYQNNPFKYYIRLKRSYCKKRDIPFDLTEQHLKSLWTGTCPISGCPITIGNQTPKGSDLKGHLDRIDPKKGYVIGNVAFISGRANRIKYDATPDELEAIAKWMRQQGVQ